MRWPRARIVLIALLAAAVTAGTATAQNPPKIDNPLNIPDLRQTLPPAGDRQAMSSTLQILLLLTVLSLAPAILVLTTSFTRIVVVLALLKQALGATQLPPSQVITTLSWPAPVICSLYMYKPADPLLPPPPPPPPPPPHACVLQD